MSQRTFILPASHLRLAGWLTGDCVRPRVEVHQFEVVSTKNGVWLDVSTPPGVCGATPPRLRLQFPMAGSSCLLGPFTTSLSGYQVLFLLQSEQKTSPSNSVGDEGKVITFKY